MLSTIFLDIPTKSHCQDASVGCPKNSFKKKLQIFFITNTRDSVSLPLKLAVGGLYWKENNWFRHLVNFVPISINQVKKSIKKCHSSAKRHYMVLEWHILRMVIKTNYFCCCCIFWYICVLIMWTKTLTDFRSRVLFSFFL